MAEDRDRHNGEDLGRPADEELIGTGDELDDEDFDEVDEDEAEDEEAEDEKPDGR